MEGSYDLGHDIKALEAAGEELRTTIEDFDDTVLESTTDGGPRGIANGGGPKKVADGFDHACDGGPKWTIDGDVDGFDLAYDGGAKGVVDDGDGG
ncbi:hypothetical protein V6N13_082632 [Hibiscus sabdariffa]